MTEHERPLRVAIYLRVSTQEQKKHGYSLADQDRELREVAAKNGWQIVEAVADEGLSGANPFRPGLRRIQELAEAGEIDFAVAINRKRWFRSIEARRGFERKLRRCGVEIRALNDTGNHIADGVDDLLGEDQRREIARETRRGRMQRARSGRVVAGVPPYGFAFNADKTNFVVNPETMPTVRRIFEMAATGWSLNGIKNALQEDGVPTPSERGKHWSRATLREMLLDDAYYPHDEAELGALCEEGLLKREVLHSLTPGPHGVWWFNRVHVETYYDHEGERERREFRENPRAEWVAVLISDAGIPQDRVRQARERIRGNRAPSGAARRFWELSGGVLLCRCGRRMATHAAKRKNGRSFYYVCGLRRSNHETCEHGAKYHRAEDTEARLRTFVLGLLRNPDTMREQVDKQLDSERAALATAGRERSWVGIRKRLDALRLERDGLISRAARVASFTDEDLDRALSGLDEKWATLQKELAGAEDHAGRLRRLEEVAALVENYLADLPWLLGDLADSKAAVREYETIPEPRSASNPLGIYTLTPGSIRHLPEEEQIAKRREAEEERGRKFRAVYEDLGMVATLDRDGTLEVRWAGGRGHARLPQRCVCETTRSSRSNPRAHTRDTT